MGNTKVLHRNEEQDKEIEIFTEFDQMGLPDELLRGIYAWGLRRPTPVQQQAIVPFMRGKDLMIKTTPGKGKSPAWAIAVLSSINPAINELQSVTLCPTRELVLGSLDMLNNLSAYMPNIRNISVMGGTPMSDDITTTRRGGQVLVGTPMRFLQVMLNEALDPTTIKILVLDELDKLLDMGYKEDLRDIISALSENAQLCAFMGDITPECEAFSQRCMRDPVCLQIKLEMPGIQQFYVECGSDGKQEALCNLITKMGDAQMIIFCNSRAHLDLLSNRLRQENRSVSVLHAAQTSLEQEENLKPFRSGSIQFLVATRLVTRHRSMAHNAKIFIQFDLPDEFETYAARLAPDNWDGKPLTVISFVAGEDDMRVLKGIKKFYTTQITALPPDFDPAVLVPKQAY